jgi:ATP phosphoribosyltransferase regulatory subunit
MNEPLHPALLPLGLRDLLPPDAAAEALVVGRMMAVLESHGYQRVKPPLAEFEESLLSGPGAAMAQETFRLMDPVSQRMIGLRADMTPQVARIAATRLRNVPRPLRLCYAGQVLRVKGGQLRPERHRRRGARRARYRRAVGRPHLAAPRPGDLRSARHRRA